MAAREVHTIEVEGSSPSPANMAEDLENSIQENARDTFFRACSACLLLGIKPDGIRQNLQEWWQSGATCPLEHWPAVDKRY